MSIEKVEEHFIESEEATIISFISIWDEELGPEIIDFYPISNVGDLEKLAIQIFTIYQFFWDNAEKDYQKTNFTLPINKISRKAQILFNIIPNPKVRGGFQPFIIVILLPDYFTDDQLSKYNEVMLRISQIYIKKKGGEIFLKDYYNEILSIYDSQISLMEKPEIESSEFYSYTAAMEDFQAGVKLFQTKNFEQAYETLKKVLFKFEHEENKHLIMEVLYIMASIFTQQKKFKTAKDYFKRLKLLAEELQHDKYFEISSFMDGFCDYKNENLITASKKFENIDISKTSFINKLQYFTIYGRMLANQENFELAKHNFLKALEISTGIKETDLVLRQKSLILYDLGVTNYKIAIEILKSSGIKKEKDYLIYLKDAINHFNRAIDLTKKLDDFSMLSQIYQLVGNIYEFIGENSKALESYDDALINAEKGNNISKKVIILSRIIQKQTELGMHEECVAIINDFLSNLDEYKFIDLYTVSNFHTNIANSLILLGKKEDGLSHLVKAYEIIKTFKTPVSEELQLLNQIVAIFSESENEERVKFYKEEIKNASNKLEKITYQKPKSFRPLGEIKEIWIFHSIAGVELYNYAMDSKIDNDLLGGFLTALHQFSMEISQKQLNDMNIGNNCYMIYQEEGYNFYILGRSEAKVSKEIMKKILSKVYRRFWKEYSEHIIDFHGNIKYFRSFTNIIEALDLTLTR